MSDIARREYESLMTQSAAHKRIGATVQYLVCRIQAETAKKIMLAEEAREKKAAEEKQKRASKWARFIGRKR